MPANDLFDWTPPPGYPERAGFKEPTTSRDAAEKVNPTVRTLRDQVLNAMRIAWPSGLTAVEAAAKLGRSELSIRPRLSELRKMEAIEPTAARRLNASGMSATVWVARRSFGGW